MSEFIVEHKLPTCDLCGFSLREGVWCPVCAHMESDTLPTFEIGPSEDYETEEQAWDAYYQREQQRKEKTRQQKEAKRLERARQEQQKQPSKDNPNSLESKRARRQKLIEKYGLQGKTFTCGRCSKEKTIEGFALKAHKKVAREKSPVKQPCKVCVNKSRRR